MNKNIFKKKIEAEQHAAAMVAEFWLVSATRIINRGESPSRLTTSGQALSRDEIDRPIYGRFARFMSPAVVLNLAVLLATEKLRAGQFPIVAGHFGLETYVNPSTCYRLQTGEVA